MQEKGAFDSGRGKTHEERPKPALKMEAALSGIWFVKFEEGLRGHQKEDQGEVNFVKAREGPKLARSEMLHRIRED